jgi:lipopolysaccharide transport system permease protein
MIRRIWQHRSLLISLVRRQYQLRYRQSFGGWIWAILPPILGAGVGTLVFHQVAGIDTGTTPYPLFIMAGLVPWTFFASSLQLGVPSIVVFQMIVSRVPFPRAVVPLSMLGLALLDLLVASVVFVIFTYVLGEGLLLSWLWVPVLLIIEVGLTAGVVLLGSAVNVFARDLRVGIPLLVQVWLFLTPVLYPLDSVPSDIRNLYLLNPMTGLIESFRDVLLYGRSPAFEMLVPGLSGAVLLLVVGSWYFRSTEVRFADVL